MTSLAQLTDASLHCELKRLVGSSNTLTAQLLAHLGEVEARGIHRERACSSLYTYCIYELRMSEDEAQRRCRAARLARQFPILLDMLAEASLHLTGLLLIGPHLSEQNHAELLARARFRTKREIELLVAEIAPCRDVPSRIVPLHRAGAADSVVSPLEDAGPGLLSRPRNSWAAYVRSLAGPVRQMEAGLAAGQAPPRAPDDEADATMSSSATGSLASDRRSSMRAATIIGRADDARTGTGASALDDRADDGLTSTGQGLDDRADDGLTGTGQALDDRADVRAGMVTTSAVDGRQNTNTTMPSAESGRLASEPPNEPAKVELRYKVQFTADQAYVDLLEEARNLLQHELPARDLVEVQRRALELLVHKLHRRKHGASERPRRSGPAPAPEAAQPEPAFTRARPLAPESAPRATHSAPKSEAPAPAVPKSEMPDGPAALKSEAPAPAALKSEAPAQPAAPKSEAPAQPAAPKSDAPAQPAALKSEAPAPAAPKSEMPEGPAALKSEAPEGPAVPKSDAPARHAAPKSDAPARPAAPKSDAPARPAAPKSEMPDGPAVPKSEVPEGPAAPKSEAPAPAALKSEMPAPAAPKSEAPARHAAPKSAKHGRYIPARVRRYVWQRDEARCAYVDARGQRCREQSGLEFHHQHPHARGGPPSIDNLSLRCRSHNGLAAEQDFGRDRIREKRAGKAS